MATAVFGSPIKKEFGETVSLTATASHLLFKPGYHEVMVYNAAAWRCAECPRLCKALYYDTSYSDYSVYAVDRDDSTHVPLDAMAAGEYLYLGVRAPVRGFYFNVSANVNANAATLDWEYLYDVSKDGYIKITGTVSGAFTVGETVTQGTSGATGVLVYGPAGSTYIVVKTTTGTFVTGAYTCTGGGSGETCSTVTAVASELKGVGYFTDVASDSDGTDSGGATLAQDGLYSFTLPSVIEGTVKALSDSAFYWYRFSPSATLSATVDLLDIIPAADTTSYGYREAGQSYQYSLNLAECGSLEVIRDTADGTLRVTWIQH